MIQEVILQFKDILDSFNEEFFDSLFKIVIAMILGMVLGIEREVSGKDAGIKTYALVSVSSAVFVIISIIVSEQYIGRTMVDPLRISSYLISGIGFIGAGIIFVKNRDSVSGLSTAASILLVCSIGMACGFGLYNIAITVTFITLFLFLTNRLVLKIKSLFKKK